MSRLNLEALRLSANSIYKSMNHVFNGNHAMYKLNDKQVLSHFSWSLNVGLEKPVADYWLVFDKRSDSIIWG